MQWTHRVSLALNLLLLYVFAARDGCRASHVQTLEVAENAAAGTVIGRLAGCRTECASCRRPRRSPTGHSGASVAAVAAGAGRESADDADSGPGTDDNALFRRKRRLGRSSTAAWPPMGGGAWRPVLVRSPNDDEDNDNDDNNALGLPPERAEFVESVPLSGSGRTPTSAPRASAATSSFCGCYAIVAGNEEGVFAVDERCARDGAPRLLVAGVLDRERTAAYSLVIEAYDDDIRNSVDGPQARRTAFFVNVTILDVNDNAPIFTQRRYTAAVAEGAPVGTLVARVSATDADSGRNGDVRYLLGSQNRYKNHLSDPVSETLGEAEKWIAVNADSGEIFLKNSPSLRHHSTHELVVVARDCGVPPLESVAFVTARVTSSAVDDDAAIVRLSFLSDDGQPRVSEAASAGDLVARVALVTDPDERSGAAFATARNSTPTAAQAALVASSVGRRLPPTDRKRLPSATAGTNTSITTGGMTVSLRGGSGHFALATHNDHADDDDDKYGAIYLVVARTPLDRELQPRHRLTIVAWSSVTALTATKTFELSVTDVNDNAPRFRSFRYDANASADGDIRFGGAVVVRVHADDRDEGANGHVRYDLVQDATGLFELDAVSGQLAVARDRVGCTTLLPARLTLAARDFGTPPLVALMSLTVTASSDESSHRRPDADVTLVTGSSLDEACALKVFTYNPECGNNITTITFLLSPEDSAEIRVSNDANEICVPRILNHERKQDIPSVEGEPQAAAADSVGDSGQYPTSRPEVDSPSETGLGVLAHRVRRSTTDFDTRNGSETQAEPHVEYKQDYITVNEAQPLGEPFYQVPLTHDSSRDLALLHFRLMSATLDSAGNGPPKCIDDAAVPPLQLSPPPLPLALSTLDGTLSLIRPLDRETQPAFAFCVSVEDSASWPPFTTVLAVQVSVADANDNAPQFVDTPSEFTVAEGSPGQAGNKTQEPDSSGGRRRVGRFFATDSDEGANGRVRYALLSDVDDFSVEPVSGELWTTKPLDREARPTYDLIVEARDAGSPSLSSRLVVRIHVADVNDNAPVFLAKQLTQFDVLAGRPPGIRVCQVRATDADRDSNGIVRYALMSIEPENDSTELFSMNAVDGTILTAAALDRDSEWLVRVVATDCGHPPLATPFEIRVRTFSGGEEPTFLASPVEFVVREDRPAGHLVGVVEAVGHEPSETLTYHILKGNPLGMFAIRPVTGELYINQRLDYEELTEQKLLVGVTSDAFNRPTIEAADPSAFRSHVASLWVTVRIEDANDNVPYILADPATLSIGEGASPGHVLTTVNAGDTDSGPNAVLRYSMLLEPELVPNETGNDDAQSRVTTQSLSNRMAMKMFSVDPVVGTITLVEPLDFERQSQYTFVVGVHDEPLDGQRQHTSRVTFQVFVQDANDNAPEIVSDEHVQVRANELLGAHVHTVLASDRDSGENGRVAFALANVDSAFNQTFANSSKHLVDGTYFFALNESNGFLTVKRRLDGHELNNDASASSKASKTVMLLNVTARDHGKPQKITHQVLRIHLIDVSSQLPAFSQTLYHASISEDASAGTPVLQVALDNVNDIESKNQTMSWQDNVVFTIVQHESTPFSIDPTSGWIKTTQSLDREAVERYNVTVFADFAVGDTNHSSGAATAISQRFATATVVIEVLDVNDNSPSFGSSCYPMRVPEGIAMSNIHQVRATDLDAGLNAEITYSITAGNTLLLFDIDPKTGRLHCNHLDRENAASHQLLLRAQDHGTPPRATHCLLNVEVLDENDNSPAFEHGEYLAAVREDASVGSEVIVISGTDVDYLGGARLTYSLAGGGSWTGDTNGEPFGTYHEHENALPFGIDTDSGRVVTMGLIDREHVSAYRFHVIATDLNLYRMLNYSVPVDVVILDINDNAPTFDRYPFIAHIDADMPLGSHVITVVAHDDDVGVNAELTYALVDGPRINSIDPAVNHTYLFHIDPDSGDVVVAGSLRGFEGCVLYVELMATDRGSPSLTSLGLLQIHVRQSQTVSDLRAPRLGFELAYYTAEVFENAAVGSEVVTVHARFLTTNLRNASRGVGSSVRYTLASDNYGVAVDEANGVIRISDPSKIDYERWVAHKDSTEEEADEELEPSHRQAGTDEQYHNNGEMHYYDEVTSPYENKNFEMTVFVIARSTILGGPDGDQVLPQYAVARVNIRIFDVNDNTPRFLQSRYVAGVLENCRRGQPVARVIAIDQDSKQANGHVSYHLISGNDDDAFALDPATGVIHTNTVLDRETHENYTLTILAADDGQPQQRSSTTTMWITVLDINDNQPVFPPIEDIYVSEDTSVGAPIGVVTANDVDVHPVLVYSINSVYEDQTRNQGVSHLEKLMMPDYQQKASRSNLDHFFVRDDEKFSIDAFTGQLTLARKLDFERQRSHLVSIFVSDGLHAAETIVKIQVLDANDNPPQFMSALYTAVVACGNVAGASAMKEPGEGLVASLQCAPLTSEMSLDVVQASDADLYDTVNYMIQPASAFVDIDLQTGQLFVKTTEAEGLAGISRRNDSHIEYVSIVAFDLSEPSMRSVAPLRVQIVSAFDSYYCFSKQQYAANIPESAAVGSLVANVTLIDTMTKGEESSTSQSKASSSSAESAGTLRLVRRVPPFAAYEIYDSYEDDEEEEYVVDDSSSPIDEEDPCYELEKSRVAKSAAIALERSKSRRRIPFAINGNGEVRLTSALDRESRVRYRLKIAGYPFGLRSGFNVTTVLTVDVIDVNDSPPEFSRTRYDTTISELTSVGSQVLLVSVIDNDLVGDTLTGSSPVTYDLTSGNGLAYFSVDTLNGSVRVAAALDSDTIEEYRLVVRARDPNRLSVASLACVIVRLTDENDNAPVFPVASYETFVQESAPIGSAVLWIHANDADRGEYGVIRYRVFDKARGADSRKQKDDASNFFTVDEVTGRVATIAMLDYEEKRYYNLTILAADGGGLRTYINVYMTVQGNDEFSPEFSENEYHFVIAGNIPLGYPFGRVEAKDADCGRDGVVFYRFVTSPRYFTINESTGVLYIVDTSLLARLLPLTTAPSVAKKEIAASVISAASPISNDRMRVSLSQSGWPEFEAKVAVEASSGLKYSLTSSANLLFTIDYALNYSYKDFLASTVVALPPSFRDSFETGANGNDKLRRVSAESSTVPLTTWPLAVLTLLVAVAVLSVVSALLFARYRTSLIRQAVTDRNKLEPVLARAYEHHDNVQISASAEVVNHYPAPLHIGYPPHYNEISHYDTPDETHMMTPQPPPPLGCASAVSVRPAVYGELTTGIYVVDGQCASSRSLTEDDEEIQMINEGRMLVAANNSGPGSGDLLTAAPVTARGATGVSSITGDASHDDTQSIISAQNTQEYLARLGIYANSSEKSTQAGDYAKIGGGDCDGMSNIIYEKLDDTDDHTAGSDQHQPRKQQQQQQSQISSNKSLQSCRILTENSSLTSVRGSQTVRSRPQKLAPATSATFGAADLERESLGSIVLPAVATVAADHSDDVSSSYNWDYLNGWSPQYHRLPAMFAEMAKCTLATEGQQLQVTDDSPITLKQNGLALSTDLAVVATCAGSSRAVSPINDQSVKPEGHRSSPSISCASAPTYLSSSANVARPSTIIERLPPTTMFQQRPQPPTIPSLVPANDTMVVGDDSKLTMPSARPDLADDTLDDSHCFQVSDNPSHPFESTTSAVGVSLGYEPGAVGAGTQAACCKEPITPTAHLAGDLASLYNACDPMTSAKSVVRDTVASENPDSSTKAGAAVLMTASSVTPPPTSNVSFHLSTAGLTGMLDSDVKQSAENVSEL